MQFNLSLKLGLKYLWNSWRNLPSLEKECGWLMAHHSSFLCSALTCRPEQPLVLGHLFPRDGLATMPFDVEYLLLMWSEYFTQLLTVFMYHSLAPTCARKPLSLVQRVSPPLKIFAVILQEKFLSLAFTLPLFSPKKILPVSSLTHMLLHELLHTFHIRVNLKK